MVRTSRLTLRARTVVLAAAVAATAALTPTAAHPDSTAATRRT
ncbi:hypothetical protein [Streptomyces sp. NPDC059092]